MENADTEPRPGVASPWEREVGGEKEKAAFMKMQLERKLCAGQEEGKKKRSLMKARKGAWPDCLLGAPEQEAVGAKGC